MAEPRRGEIWIVDWSPGRGSEQQGKRPAVVVQTDVANKNARYPNTIVLTLSTKGFAVSSHVIIEPSAVNRLRERSYVKCEQIMTISKARLEQRIGELSAEEMRKVEIALRRILALQA